MKKRLTCLLLCLVMLFSLVLASCSEKTQEQAAEDISDAASETAMTLTMWVVSEEEVSPAAANAVSKAINTITNSKFKTKLVMYFFTEEEYRDKLEATIVAYEETRKQQGAVEVETETTDETGDTTPVTDETETNEFGLTVIKYPEALANQVDIIYISGEDMYIDFINNGWLTELDTELSSSSKKIKEYVSTTLMAAAKYNGSTYAVPNNRVIGDYTYMLLNKELLQKYSQEGYVQYGQIDGFFNEKLYLYLQTVYEIESQFDPNVVPIDSSYEECLELLAHYWSFDTDTYDKVDKFSIFGSHYKDMESLSRGSVTLGYGSLFEDADFANAFIQLNKYKYGTDGKGSYFGDATGKTAAVKFVTGDSTVLSYNEKEGAYEYVETVGDKKIAYYPIVVKYPTASSEDIYGNMFGVCSYTRDLVRSMEIVTYLNTNSDFRNLLQYGIEGTHYEVKEDADGNKTVKRLSNEYLMDIYATGNVFLAYPEPEMSADIWESGKVQNRYSLVEPLLGLDFAAYAATTGEAPADITLPKQGYTYSYTTGYSKDVLGQDELLAKWFSESDTAGKGVYIYATEIIEGQNRTIYYYVYNNNVSSKVKFDVEDIREVEVQTDDNGKTTEVQTNLDFLLSYTNQSGTPKNNYEISLMKLYTRKTNDFEIKVRVGNDSVTPVVTTKTDGIIDFDFHNTDGYRIELYETLPKPTFRKNAMIDSWLEACDGKGVREILTHVMEYSQEKNGKMEYTFIVYRTGLKNVTTTQIVPTGNNGELNVAFDFSYKDDEKLDLTTEANYLLHYIRITVDKDTKVSYSISTNGRNETVAKANKTVADTDPDFTILGNLDTEMVKYLSGLNDALLAKLDACKTYEEVAALVGEMHKLLVTTGTPPSASQFVLLTDLFETYPILNIVQCLQEAVATTTEKQVDSEGLPLLHRGEEYVYFDSPNTIYHKWLTEFGYQPATKK